MLSSITNNSVKSIIWSAIERFSVQALQFLLTIILARFVTPSEYGLISMLTIFISIAQSLVDSGFSSALVQKNNRSEIDFSTVFYFNIAISLFVYTMLFISAPYIASFYNQPLIEIVCKWMGLGIVFQSFSAVQIARLTISLDFKTQAKASLISIIISGIIGVYLAYNDYGVWALLVQSLLNNLINTILLWFFAKWIPSFMFSINSLKSLFSFGSKLLFSGLLHTIYYNLYSLVIGKKYSSAELGLFNQSTLTARFPSLSLMSIISRAIYPIQCSIQDNEELLKSTFIKYLKMSCYIIFPIMISISIISKPLIQILLSDNWINMSTFLSILCIAYLWIPIMIMNNQILLVKGRSDYFLKSEVIKKIIGVIILIITIPFGITIMCFGILVYNLTEIVVIIYFSKKVISISYFEQLNIILPYLLISIAMGSIMILFMYIINDIILQLILCVSMGIITYVTISKFFNIKEFNFLILKFNNLRSSIL